MVTLTRAGVAFDGLFPGLRRVIDDWDPGHLKSEKEFKDSLVAHLHQALPSGTRIEKEYRDGGTTCDIYLKWQGLMLSTEVFFELKHNLSRKTDFDRLVGQIIGLEPLKRNIVVVLCGDTDKALLARLVELFENNLNDESVLLNMPSPFFLRNLRIIEKSLPN